jgi:rod shape determining protein RodA
LVALVIGLSLSTSALTRIALPAYLLGLGLLLLVLVFGVTRNNSLSWFSIAGVTFQPSEVVKLAVILFLARQLSRFPPPAGGYGFRGIILPAIIVGVPFLMILGQRDLGTGLTLGAVGVSMVLFMGVRPRLLLMIAVVGLLGLIPAWGKLQDYQKRRIMTVFNPEADPRGAGYHVRQSIIAVGSGSVTGKGYMNGTQTQLQFLPEHTTDFIFSVLAEEWGFFGCGLVLAAYLFLLTRLLWVVHRSKDLFAALVVFGVASLIFVHVLVNVGMVIGILPVVGIPLTLFSYGGSAIVAALLGLGVALGISMRRFQYVSGGMIV